MTFLHVVVPSRGRPQALTELAHEFYQTCGLKTPDYQTRLTFAVDYDDPARQQYGDALQALPKIGDWGIDFSKSPIPTPVLVSLMFVENHGASGMTAALNQAVEAWLPPRWPGEEPAGFMFMGDDHRPRTPGWDRMIVEALQRYDIAYGNDLFQGPNLPTQYAIRTPVVKALGWMSPPAFRHLYVDNAILDMGRALNSIAYLPDVVIEHMHPAAGKGELDEHYTRANSNDSVDRETYMRWRRDELAETVIRVRAMAYTANP